MQDREIKKKAVKVKNRKIKVHEFPSIPDKLYFSIGEVSKLCVIRPYVIRFWEQVFPQLKPAKLRCGRRYYCKEEIVLIRTIRTLLYEKGFTIDGARTQLANKAANGDGIIETDQFFKSESEQLQVKEDRQLFVRSELVTGIAYEKNELDEIIFNNPINELDIHMDVNALSKQGLSPTTIESSNNSTILHDVANHIENILSLIDSIFEMKAVS